MESEHVKKIAKLIIPPKDVALRPVGSRRSDRVGSIDDSSR
jgi:hypothetical protein